MTTIAVVAHRRKVLGGGLGELHDELARHGVTDPLWYEVDKSKQVPKCVRQALRDGAEVVFAWGGDGTVQRAVDVLAGTRPRSPSCRLVRRTSSPTTWACRSTWPSASRSVSRAGGGPSTSAS
jgi:hypothetical protein